MYGVIGEADSDAATLKVLIRKITNNKSLKVLVKDYNGCGEILKQGSRQLQAFSGLGCKKFVVCHDADGPDPSAKYNEIQNRVITPSGCDDCCIVIPVHEIEAWILADIDKVAKFISPSWTPSAYDGDPEAVSDAQEYIEKMSRNSKKRPRYSHTTDNAAVAEHLDLDRVKKRCKSFRPFIEFVQGKSKGNHGTTTS